MTSFACDAAGQRVKTVQPDDTVIDYPFPGYEVENPGTADQVIRSSYSLAGQVIAVRKTGMEWREDFDDGSRRPDGAQRQLGSSCIVYHLAIP